VLGSLIAKIIRDGQNSVLTTVDDLIAKHAKLPAAARTSGAPTPTLTTVVQGV
jgi:hypothetical protein